MRVSASLQRVGDGGRLNCAVAMISAGGGGARRQICHAGYVRWANHGHNMMLQVASTSQREWHTLGGGGSSSTWSWRLQQRVRGGGHRGAAAVSRSELRGSAADDEEEAEAQVRPPSPDPLGISTRNLQQYTYLFAALASSVGITSLAAASVYYRFAWQMQGGEISYIEMFGCLSLALGAAVGMEFWARWAHRALWHASLWHMHESHHRPRVGPFELNDIFAIINAIPAITLMAFGFLHKGLFPGLCFGAGLGITVFGMAYMFVHDGLVHRRFPVGPIANVPYFRKVAAAHQLHHADKFHGVPYGLFLGPKELQEVGGQRELDKLLLSRKQNSSSDRHTIDV